jgi:probable phosphoglycerate mutase
VTKLLLARHGETDWNRERRWQGHADPPLNDLGREQARQLADRLAGEPLAAIYSSDLRRAHETASIVARGKGMDVLVDRDLREIDIGRWSGLTHDEIRVRFPDDFRRWREGRTVVGRGGETHEELTTRVLAAARRIAAAHPAEAVLIVSHGGALKTLALHAEAIERDRRLENCGVVPIVFEDGGFRRHRD